MQRGTRISLVAGILALLFGWTIPLLHAEERVLRIGYVLPSESPLGVGTDVIAKQVASRTNGRYRLEAYPNGSLGGEAEMIEEIQRGHLDLAFLTSGPFGGVIPELGIFDTLFLIRDAAHAHAVFDSPLGRDYLTKFRDKGMVALAWGENGMRHVTNSKRPVRSPDDLKGLKLRVPSAGMVAGFKALGADAQPLGFPALYGALQSGQFDGQENPIAVITASHFDRVQKHLTLTGHVYSWAVIVMSPAAWASLSEADRQVFVEAAKAGGEVSRQVAADAEKRAVETMAKQGIEVVAVVDRAAFERAVAPATAAAEQKYGKDLLDRIRQAQ